jgi:hypothetical protein
MSRDDHLQTEYYGNKVVSRLIFQKADWRIKMMSREIIQIVDWENRTMDKEILRKQSTDKKKGRIAYGTINIGNNRTRMFKP